MRELCAGSEDAWRTQVQGLCPLIHAHTGTSIVPVQSGSIGERLPALASENCKRLARLVALELRRPSEARRGTRCVFENGN
jgi:hypothetical protein